MDFHISQFLSPGRKEFVKGTLLLTGAGLFCRVLGFFYRIYMSRTIGAEGLGLYNMIHPLFSIAFAVCAGSIQTALSQYIAASQEKGPAVFKCGLFLSLSLSVIPLLLLWKGKMFLAGNILSEPPGSPLSSGTGSFRTICLSPCLHQRLLLWNEQGSYSVFFTDRRAGDPYGCSVAVGGVSGKKWKISYSRSGSRRPSDRRNGIGSFYISGAVSGAAAEERETK